MASGQRAGPDMWVLSLTAHSLVDRVVAGQVGIVDQLEAEVVALLVVVFARLGPLVDEPVTCELDHREEHKLVSHFPSNPSTQTTVVTSLRLNFSMVFGLGQTPRHPSPFTKPTANTAARSRLSSIILRSKLASSFFSYIFLEHAEAAIYRKGHVFT